MSFNIKIYITENQYYELMTVEMMKLLLAIHQKLLENRFFRGNLNSYIRISKK